MMILFFSCFIFFLLAVQIYRVDSKLNALISLFIFSFFVFIYGLRDRFSGADTKVYSHAFESINHSLPQWELGFVTLTKAISTFTDSPATYIFFLCFITLIVIAVSCAILDLNREDKYSSLLFLLIMCTYSMFDLLTNGLRQGVGVSISFLALMLYLRTEYKFYIVILLTSLLFHNSLGILILSFFTARYLKKNKNISKYISYVTIIMMISVLVFNINYIEVLIGDFSSITIFHEYDFLKRFSSFQSIDSGFFSSLNLTGKLSLIIPQLIPVFIFLIFGGNHNRKLGVIYLTYCIVTIIYAIFIFQPYSYRYSYIVSLLAPLIITEVVLFNYANTIHRSFKVSIVIILSFLYMVKFVFLSESFSNFNYVI